MQTLTVKCKIEGDTSLLRTAEVFAEACNAVVPIAHEHRTTNKITLQKLAYGICRNLGLSANLSIQAIRRVATALKKNWNATFRPTSIAYDERIFSLRATDWTVSLSTIDGRKRYKLLIGNYQRHLLSGQRPTACTVSLNRQGMWYCNIVVDVPTPAPASSGQALGVDLGIRKIATLSTGKKITGRNIQAKRAKYHAVRASLQSKHTQGAKAVLRQLSGKEQRYGAWMNHTVSKAIVREAMAHGCTIIRFERLKGIRARTKTWSKHLNRMIASWSFYQLIAFTVYKANLVGIRVEFIHPAYTSQTCHTCLRLGVRTKERFVCTACGEMDADDNAAHNLKAGGVGVGEIPADGNATRTGR